MEVHVAGLELSRWQKGSWGDISDGSLRDLEQKENHHGDNADMVPLWSEGHVVAILGLLSIKKQTNGGPNTLISLR